MWGFSDLILLFRYLGLSTPLGRHLCTVGSPGCAVLMASAGCGCHAVSFWWLFEEVVYFTVQVVFRGKIDVYFTEDCNRYWPVLNSGSTNSYIMTNSKASVVSCCLNIAFCIGTGRWAGDLEKFLQKNCSIHDTSIIMCHNKTAEDDWSV